MSPVRPDIVECWVFRIGAAGSLEFLLIRRAQDRIFPGIWQPVTGGLGASERAPLAALREVEEETGLGPAEIEAFYDLDHVASFYAEGLEAVVSSVIYAVRVHADAVARVSIEHDALEWVSGDEARRRSIWPAYREALARIERLVAEPDWARWFEVDLSGHRLAR
jgi:8-oxo-dGTP pyrophosphatase MutT (NUDIX family)